jgi:hypothetical protein
LAVAAEPTPPAAAPTDPRRFAVPGVLALILLVALGLRLWGIHQGLPYAYNLDERAHFVPYAVQMTGGKLDPGYFINPPAFTYMIAAWLGVLHIGGDVTQLFASDPGQVFLDARVLTLLLSLGAVAATFFAGRAFFGRGAGLLAAAIMAVSFLPVFYSRQALNDGPAVLPCALALWASAKILNGGGRRAYAAAGASVGLAAAMKYSDGVIVLAVIAAALAAPERDLKRLALSLGIAAGAAILVVVITDPYMLADWHTFLHDLDRQRKFANGDALLGQPERNGWVYYARTMSWALGVVPALAAVIGGALLVVKRRREAWVFGVLIVVYWLYMGSQHRFYVRWMLPLYPALAILAAYAALQLRKPVPIAVAAAALLIPTAIPTIRNATVMARTDTRTLTRDWLVAHVPRDSKVVFEPIAPTEWYGVTPGGGPKADPARQWQRYNRSKADIAELAKTFRGAKREANFQNYERTLTPAIIDIYRREGFCYVVSGSMQYGRALAEPKRAPQAIKYYKALASQADLLFKASPLRKGHALPRYQVDRSFNFIDGAYYRPGPVMKVYKLRNCGT